MFFETHLTVAPQAHTNTQSLVDDVEAWKAICENHNLSPLHFDLFGSDSHVGAQTMSAASREFDSINDAIVHAKMQALDLEQRYEGVSIARIKIEVPLDHDHVALNFDADRYMESHICVQIESGGAIDPAGMYDIAMKHGCGISKNVLNQPTHSSLKWIFLTMRRGGTDAITFRKKHDFVCKDLARAKFLVRTKELEYVMYDSNPALDANWMTIS